MKKLFIIFITFLSFNAFAGNWALGYMDIEGDVGGVTIEYNLSEEDADLDLSIGVLFGTKDYVECSGGICSGVEIDPSAIARASYNINENFFVWASFISFNYTAAAAGYGAFAIESDSENEVGLGLGFNAGPVSFGADRFDDATVVSLTYNF